MLATFCVDATIEFPGMGRHAGTDELRAAYTKWQPRGPQRHLVVNTHVTEWSATDAAAVSDMVFLLKTEAGWVTQVVGRYDDRLRCEPDGVWRFVSRTAAFS